MKRERESSSEIILRSRFEVSKKLFIIKELIQFLTKTTITQFTFTFHSPIIYRNFTMSTDMLDVKV